MEEFLIIFIRVEWKNRNSIVDLKQKGEDWIVNNNHFLNRPIRNDPQIFHETEPYFLSIIWCIKCFHAMLTIQTVCKKLMGWVQKVKNCICILLIWGSKSN